MRLQYMLIPAIGVDEGSTGAMENNPIKKQWIPTNSTVHLIITSNPQRS
jgi:hypothetical protein